MRHATDAMEAALVLPASTTIPLLARKLLAADADGACICAPSGKVLGVVTAMDLVFREAPVHAPTVIALFDFVWTFGKQQTDEDLARIQAQTAAELMTPNPRIANASTPLTEVAGWMRDDHLSMIPVVVDDKLVGVVTRRSMVRHTLSHFTG